MFIALFTLLKYLKTKAEFKTNFPVPIGSEVPDKDSIELPFGSLGSLPIWLLF